MDSSPQIAISINGSLFRRHKKFTVFFSLLLLILLLLLFSNTVFSPSILRRLKSLPFPIFTPNRFYCRFTPYEDLCYESISSSISTSDPNHVFHSSIKFAINELNATATSIAKAQSTAANASQSPVLSNCLAGTRESIKELNTALAVALDFTWLSYEEGKKIKDITRSVKANGFKCLGALQEEKEKLVGVELEKVKFFGVEKATKCVSNIIGLLDARDGFLSEDMSSYEFVNDYYFEKDYVFRDVHLVWLLYGAMYVLIAVLYFLFWRM